MATHKKVFCSECRHFKARGQIEDVCYHPHAVEMQEDWHGRRSGRASAAMRNQRNDCPDFTPLRWWDVALAEKLALLGLALVIVGILGLWLWR